MNNIYISRCSNPGRSHDRLLIIFYDVKIYSLQDISMSPKCLQKIKEIQSERDILIMYSSGSPQQSRVNVEILTFLCYFLRKYFSNVLLAYKC